MRPRALRRRLALIGFGGMLICGLATAGLAKAQTVDDVFVATLDRQGIAYTSEPAAISAGHAVCELRDTGLSEIEAAMFVMNNSPLTAYNSGFFVGASEVAYCPWHHGVAAGTVRA